MSRLPRLLVLMFLVAFLAACGNKGDLVKPTPPVEPATAPATPG